MIEENSIPMNGSSILSVLTEQSECYTNTLFDNFMKKYTNDVFTRAEQVFSKKLPDKYLKQKDFTLICELKSKIDNGTQEKALL